MAAQLYLGQLYSANIRPADRALGRVVDLPVPLPGGGHTSTMRLASSARFRGQCLIQ